MENRRDDLVCLILAAGQGKRMRSSTCHKVCFPVAGRPAILRAMDAYRAAGVGRFVVVVGAMAGQVVETVGQEFPETLFVYQPVRLGTGNAVRAGVAPLRAAGFAGRLLVTMGDKLVDASAVARLLAQAARTEPDVLVGVRPRQAGSEGGRVLLNPDGRLAGILERRDIQRAAVVAEARRVMAAVREETAAADLASLASLVAETFPDPLKRQTALGELEEALATRDRGRLAQALVAETGLLETGAAAFTAGEAEAAAYENAALYLFQAPALYEGLTQMTTANAQREEYLTQAINYLAGPGTGAGHKVEICPLEQTEVLTFNNPEELLLVEEVFRRRLAAESTAPAHAREVTPDVVRTVREWLQVLDSHEGLRAWLRSTYGPDPNVWERRLDVFRKVLTRFREAYGWERGVVLTRAPGRVNLMGRHVEHRGGCINVMAISQEVVLAASPREDDLVRIKNLDSSGYPDAEFRVGAELAGLSWDDWLSYINHDRVQNLVKESAGNWANYVKAAFLRLQFQCRNRQLKGFDAVFSGDIPVAAGLSSSSAVVVATAEAAVALNDLDLAPQDFVDLCGEGEWYVGSRGGAGDHAAMKFGKLGQVTQIRFFPFTVQPGVPFPDEYCLVVVNSHVQARKMTNAKDMFNQRVAAYEIGLALLRQDLPHLAGKMARLRDVTPQTLGMNQSGLYAVLRSLPETMTRAEVRRRLSADLGPELERLFRTHAEPPEYLIRSVVLYGIAECQRSARCRDLIKDGDLAGLGRLMYVSHDGDRVVSYQSGASGWTATPWDYSAPDSYLDRLIADLKSQELDRVARAQLHLQPGGYACSTPELDELVDLSRQVPGVVGAQLSGAGLGGCIMVLVRREAVAALEDQLTERFYAPRSLAPAFTISTPVRGSGLVRIP